MKLFSQLAIIKWYRCRDVLFLDGLSDRNLRRWVIQPDIMLKKSNNNFHSVVILLKMQKLSTQAHLFVYFIFP